MHFKNWPWACLILPALLIHPPVAWSVDCTPDTITLSTQAEVDNFQANHGPGCDTVVTGLIIDGASINDLSALSGLTATSTVGPFSSTHQLRIANTSLTST